MATMGFKRRRRWIIFGVSLFGYVLVMTFGGCADKLILFPSSQPIAASGADRWTIRQSSRQIEVWTARSDPAKDAEPEAYILEFTGNATRAEQIVTYVASRWNFAPVEVNVMNYPGYGGSTGPARLSDIGPAALAVYDQVAKMAESRPIILAGNSLGTTAALYVAANRPVAGLVFQNPPPLKQLILGKFGWWNLWLLAGPISMQIPSELNSLENAPRVNARAVFILAGGDELVSPKYQQKVVDAYAGEKKIINIDGGHNDSVNGDDERRLRDALEWLLKT
jgi:fermentation-respiration switch protein FrsA (DUF1100 family)